MNTAEHSSSYLPQLPESLLRHGGRSSISLNGAAGLRGQITIFGVPEVVPGINVKETISTGKFGVNYRFGTY